jgi:hypothetical protein
VSDYGRNTLGRNPPSHYAPAEVCMNGHPTTGDISEEPELTANFCSSCGSATIRACPHCNGSIRGSHRLSGAPSLNKYVPPNHCHNCGSAFPWTQSKIVAAKEHAAEIDGLNDGERNQLQVAIDDLVAGGAKTDIAASHFKRLMKRAGQTAGGSLYRLVVDIVSETAKKALTSG